MTTTAAPAARDVRLLFTTRALRLFGFGFLSVVLVLHLSAAGLSQARIGLLLGLALLGDTAISLWITTRADRLGRRRLLVASAVLVVVAGVLLATASSFAVLLFAATVGVVSPGGNEVGPFLAIEQAALSERVAPERRVHAFAWYQLAGSLATASGALAAGLLADGLQRAGLPRAESYRAIALGYGAIGLALAALFTRLSPGVEAPARAAGGATRLGLHRSRGTVLRLSGLFAVDAFAGGFIVQSWLAWWFQQRFGATESLLGALFFGANVLAGLSALAAARVARRFGLVNTMVFTHLPSNVMLALVPLMPTFPLAAALLLARFSISQMDVPTRQAFTMAVVEPDERSAAAGVTGIARTIGAALSPMLAGPLYASAALASVPFVLCGGLKVAYDLLLWRAFRAAIPPPSREAVGAPRP